ncbi:hypothetical protein LEP1GSC060_0218 [Leptospira weilii serovar Ranarum str. ICFT]|uniref:Uncharacterized protein n=1 Tax=Leptospira weilii serovar Ranarum str. ICFT TaxID=1218598 RepID=N1WBX5_9LEPT|nr:hypothetical protein LEP1GSC060_0218 [Leptospira weilii serovar Ranarum str. ICFT]
MDFGFMAGDMFHSIFLSPIVKLECFGFSDFETLDFESKF